MNIFDFFKFEKPIKTEPAKTPCCGGDCKCKKETDKNEEAVPNKEIDIEVLAALEHAQWANWADYFIKNNTPDNIAKWKKQMKTPYTKLTEEEKEKDRYWVYKILDVLQCE